MNKKRFKKVISKVTILISIFLGYYFFCTKFNITIPCIFKKITNLYCPGCGITRCLFSLLELDYKSAFHHNALVCILLPIFIVYEITEIYNYIMMKPIKNFKYKKLSYFILIITIIFGILRNIEKFSFLAP